MEVIALVLPLVGAVGIRKRNFLYLGRKRFIFNILKHVPLVLMKTKQLGRFLGVAGGWNMSVWIASLLLSARRWWKRLNIRKLVVFTSFSKFLDGTIGRAMGTDGCVNRRLQRNCCSY